MHMIVGLGNHGPPYARHRHNIGYQILDALAHAHGLSFGKRQSKALIATGHIAGRRLLLVKPETYMNGSGEAVQPLAAFYKVDPAQLLVIFDDLDLPLGRLRLRPFGGAGGHNGMKSIIARLGTQAFPRLRVGIGRPPGRMDAADYVLHDFSAAEEEIMAPVRERAVQAILLWLHEGSAATMNAFNSDSEAA
ncbi:MAG: aminoacyl-tRNA hydrolase [Caldilineales bacterium]|nr:aminoacyl-tRNA hydrolase [Caldilineales bacterium]